MSGLFRKKVPIVMQAEAAECGAASLSMILGYYGCFLELKQLRKDCKVSRDGSKLTYIIEAAQKYGMETKAMRCPPDMRDISLPAIAFWGGYHFLVVEKITDKEVTLCDPELGRRKITKREFMRGFTGIALELKPGADFKKMGKPFRTSRVILSFLGDKPDMIVYTIILSLLLNLIGVILPLFMRLFTDVYLPAIGRIDNYHFISLYFTVISIQAGLLILQNAMQRFFTRQFSASMSARLVKKLLRTPLYFFQERRHSALIEYLKSTDTFAVFLASQLVPLCVGIMLSVLYLGMMFYYSPAIAVAILISTALIMLLMIRLIAINKEKTISSINDRIGLLATVMQTVTMFDMVKSTGQEAGAKQKALSSYNNYRNSAQKVSLVSTYIQAFPVMIPLLMQTVVLAIGVPAVIEDEITVGILLALESMSISFIAPLLQFISQFLQLEAMGPQIRAVSEIESEDDDPMVVREGNTEAKCMSKDDIQGGISLHGVTFGYNAALPPVVRDINIEIPAGKSIALVGGSGSGKSTIIKLIQGLYSPWEGEVLIDGIPLKDTDRDVITDSMTVAPQTMSFFTGTIRDNITMFDNSIPTAKYVQAAVDADINDAISALPNGYHTMIDSEAKTLSGGQRQRLMLSRALIREPKILIMDEATSALDTLSEKQVMDNIKNRNITRIIVAHRLSAIRDCDEILVLDKGHIVQRGRHEQLMNEEGLYRKLVLTEENDA